MSNPTAIANLWAAGCLPIKSALYRADGMARAVRIEPGHPGRLELLEIFSVESLLAADPEYVTHIDVTLERVLPDDSGYLICGEGSYGSEGFFGRLDSDKRLVWVVYLEDDNPFVDVVVESSFAIFTSNLGLAVGVDLQSVLA